MFDKIAANYDIINHILSLGIDISWRKKAAVMLKPFQNGRILDIACGTADFSIEIYNTIKPGQITGIDISEEMIEAGQKKINKKGMGEKIRLFNRNALNTGFDNEYFDAAGIAFGIRNISDRTKALNEIQRVIKKEGMLVILEFSLPHGKLTRRLYNFYLNKFVPLAGGLLSFNYKAYKYLSQSITSFPPKDQFCKLINSCGFTVTQATPLSYGIVTLYVALKQ